MTQSDVICHDRRDYRDIVQETSLVSTSSTEIKQGAVHSKPFAFYDMTRLVSKRFSPVGTGIDRVDLRFAQAILEEHGENCFPIVRVGRKGFLIDRKLARSLVRSLERTWFHGCPCEFRTAYTFELAGLTQSVKGPSVYLFPETHNLSAVKSIVYALSRRYRNTRGQSFPRVNWPTKIPRDWVNIVLVSFPTAVLVAITDLLLKLPIILSRWAHNMFRKDARQVIPRLMAGGISGCLRSLFPWWHGDTSRMVAQLDFGLWVENGSLHP